MSDRGTQFSTHGCVADFARAAEVAVHVEDKVHPDIVTADQLRRRHRTGDGEQAAAGTQRRGQAGQAVARQGRVDCDVDAGGVVRLLIADDLGCAELAQYVGVGVGRCGGHVGLRCGRQRNQGGADAAARPDDQHVLARLPQTSTIGDLTSWWTPSIRPM
ncbi:hypothetical protein BIV25_01000 [Streptomyces sp. MUSC 14]|nr:hypothetical protein BIV25_01000 [Streptomyces sp. MUSC 14]